MKPDKVTEFSKEAWYRVIKGAFELEDVIEEQYALIQQGLKAMPVEEGAFATPINVDLIVGEWGNWHNIDLTTPSILWQQCTMRDAITTALTLDIFHRNCDKVQMACVAQSVNVLNSLFLTNGNETVLTPNYYVFKMYEAHKGGHKIDLALETNTLGNVCKEDLKKIYSFASVKDDVVTVNIVNVSADDSEKMTINFGQKVEYISGSVLSAENMNDYNEFGVEELVNIKAAVAPEIDGTNIDFEVAKSSVTVLQFKLDENWEEKQND